MRARAEADLREQGYGIAPPGTDDTYDLQAAVMTAASRQPRQFDPAGTLNPGRFQGRI